MEIQKNFEIIQTKVTTKLLKKEFTSRISHEEIIDICEILIDKEIALLLRYFKKQRHDIEITIDSIVEHIQFRITNDLSNLNYSNLSPPALLFFENGLSSFINGHDKSNSPLLLMRLSRLDGANIDSLRSHLLFVMETGRRLIQSINHNDTSENETSIKVLQLSLILDINGFGFNCFKYEMIPVMSEIFSKQYPSIIGNVYILNFGWVHAGIWAILKPMLSTETQEKLYFINQKQLKDHVSVDFIPIEYGGLYDATPVVDIPIIGMLNSQSLSMSEEMTRLQSMLTESSTAESEDEEVWYDATSSVMTIKSVQDLQQMIHSKSPRKHRGRSLSSVSNSSSHSKTRAARWGSASLLSNARKSSSPERLTMSNEFTKRQQQNPKLIKIFIKEVAKSPNPAIGFGMGIMGCIFEWSCAFSKRLRNITSSASNSNIPPNSASTSNSKSFALLYNKNYTLYIALIVFGIGIFYRRKILQQIFKMRWSFVSN